MKTWILTFVAALVVLAVLDFAWLGFIARDFYASRLGPLLREQPLWAAAILFYLVHAAAIATFAVPLALAQPGWAAAILYGAALGFCAYAAYDLTNLATLRGWPLSVTLVDLAWGTFVTAVATTVAFALVKP
jgi:uncharacterized membrane protein